MRATPACLITSVLVAMLCLSGCGGDVELDVTQSDNRKRITGTVELPNGELAAHSADLWQRLAGALVGRVQALTGNAFPVGAGVRVELVRLSSEAAAADGPGEFIDAATTLEDGSYTVILPRNTDGNICRFLVQVGDADDGTLTRALIYNNTGPIRIDFRSEAAVRLILEGVPPSDFCTFDSADIAAIVAAVDAAPGDIDADDVASANAAATTAAAADAGVQAAIAAALQ
jgi:hypothetical protein